MTGYIITEYSREDKPNKTRLVNEKEMFELVQEELSKDVKERLLFTVHELGECD